MVIPKVPIGDAFESIIEWLTDNLEIVFDGIEVFIEVIVESMLAGMEFLPPFVFIVLLSLLAWKLSGRGIALFTLLGFTLIVSMDLWEENLQTFAMIVTSAIVSLGIGIPFGIMAAKNNIFFGVIRPLLDFMQTLPPFVYLIPAVIFFSLGIVPGVIATIIFSMPPAIRLTNLGIRQVDKEVVEAARAFGSTSKQMLFKVQLPLAVPTIMAGVNQTIMLSLSMVVIASMIGAGGLGNVVLRGITQLQIGLGFEGGVAVVILAIFLDRITQSLQNL